jgi:hypothetical protein
VSTLKKQRPLKQSNDVPSAPRKTRTKQTPNQQMERNKIRANINEIETKQTIQRINETKSWFFEKIDKINKPLANMTKQRKEKMQFNKIRDEKGDITTNEMKSRDSLESTLKVLLQLYSSKLENLDEMDKSLDAYI